jgi:hypothetical protein
MIRERKIVKEYLKKYLKEEYLPVKLVNKIDEKIFNNKKYGYLTKNNFLRCIATIYYKQVNDYHNLEYYVPAGSAYWKKVFGGNYHEKVIKPLIDFGIVEFYDFGYRNYPNTTNDKSRGKETGSVGIRYRINTDLTSDHNSTIIPYIVKNNSEVLTAEECLLNNRGEFLCEPITDKGFHVHIDKHKAYKWIDENAENICMGYFRPDYPDKLPVELVIKYHLFLKGGSFNEGFTTIETVKSMASLYQFQLFFFKDTFYVADPHEFLQARIKSMKYYYKRDIDKINNLPIVNKRSYNTLRLHNHLVNFPSKILQFININNRTVVQLDLRTSQFLIFANLLNVYINSGEKALLKLFKKGKTKAYLKRLIGVLKEHQSLLPKTAVNLDRPDLSRYSSHDVTRFIRDVFYDDFYSIVQEELSLPDRGLAKLILFILLFRRSQRKDILIRKLEERYPVVMSIIAGFKANENESQSRSKGRRGKNDTSNFSVFLQCVEAEIFIDKILYPLREQGIPCFSRHDSIVVEYGYEDAVELYSKAVFAGFGFKYNHKVEDKFWEVADEDEMEEMDYMQWLIDENKLNSNFSVDDSIEQPERILTNKSISMEVEQIKTCIRLKEIGYQKDYFNYVDQEFLEDVSNLPLPQDQKNILYNDVMNLQDGFSFLQSETNIVLQEIFRRIEPLDLPEDFD